MVSPTHKVRAERHGRTESRREGERDTMWLLSSLSSLVSSLFLRFIFFGVFVDARTTDILEIQVHREEKREKVARGGNDYRKWTSERPPLMF